LRAGLNALRSTGREVLMSYFLGLLAQAHAAVGQVEEALNTLAEPQIALDDGAERWWQAELYRLRGEMTLRKPGFGPDDEREAEECFLQALSTARERHSKSLELRAATSLSRLCQKQGRQTEARRTLAGVYDWF